MEKQNFLIIDSHALIHRAFHAFPVSLKNHEGINTNAVYGFTSLMLDVIIKFKPKKIVAVFDSKGPTIRESEFSAYKANRSEVDSLLVQQFPLVHNLVESFGIPILIQDGIEADDLIGTLDSKFSNSDFNTIIVTGDRDLLQLVDKDTSVYLAGAKFSQSKLYSLDSDVVEKMGVLPNYIPDLKGLCGDQSDNIPGVKGIGMVGAAKLINQFGILENIYKNLDSISEKYKNLLIESYEIAMLSKKLATIYTDIPISLDLKEISSFNLLKIDNLFTYLGFNSLKVKLKRLEKLYGIKEEAPEFNLFSDTRNSDIADDLSHSTSSSKLLEFDLKNIESGILTSESIYLFFDIKKTDNTCLGLDSEYLIFTVDGINFYKVLNLDFKSFFLQFKNKNFVTFGKKDFVHLSFNLKFNLPASIKDLGIYTYFLTFGKIKFDFNQALSFFKLDQVYNLESKLESLFKINDLLASLPENKDIEFLNLVKLEDSIILQICKMEQKGISVDPAILSSSVQDLKNKLEELKSQIYKNAGREFNIASPAQVSKVLFSEKGLFYGKKTKGGSFSTSESVLKSIQDLDPIVPLILKFREISKVVSTYIEPLPLYVDKFKKIHADFDQFGAISGRFASKNPNLQNIPKEEIEGVNIRNYFIATTGYKFLSFDYSQQELRILAALSGEEKMIESFKNDQDIHSLTASELFNVPVNSVTKEQRSIGKTINFSVIYGISAFGLSERLKIDRKLAQSFIDSYFTRYPKVLNFMQNIYDSAKELGYSKTVLGRKRYSSLITSLNKNLRSAAERELFNFVIQGSAADVMKLALKNLTPVLEKYKSFLILQIHDEFVFEYPESEIKNIDGFVEEIKSVMLNAYLMQVPYQVGVTMGYRWGDL